MSYYNTTHEKDVKPYVEKARTQDEIIKAMINKLDKPFSCKDIFQSYPIMHVPITSIRRSLDTLKKSGFIIETGNKKEGLFGRKELELKKA